MQWNFVVSQEIDMAFKEVLVRSFPALGIGKRFAVAIRDKALPRSSHAQNGEDLRILELLNGFDLNEGWYFDIGANHPTDISNTYLLYRRGVRGVIIEPNIELLRLFSLVRPRDIALPIGCSDKPGIAKFSISKTPVLSSLDPQVVGDIWKTVHIPVLPLDVVVEDVDPTWIPLLSIDVEGHSGPVLDGAARTLERTYLACIEASEGTAEEEHVLAALKRARFTVVGRCACNILALNDRATQFERFRVGRQA
jgi:FkbM family methyltransferase